MANTVVGIYDNLDNAREAKRELVNRGFSSNKIDLSAKGEEHVRKDKESMSGFFGSLFGNTEEAKTYTEAGYRGYVVTVHVENLDEAERVASILDAHGVINPSDTTEMGTDKTEMGTKRTVAPSSETSIPVIEENMEVGKREVETGNVRIKSRIIERPVEEHLRLREEFVDVERIPADRPATAADWDQLKERDIEITEHAEEPVVNKEARVVEEIKVNKEIREHEETMRDTVKRKDVEVDEKKREEECIDC